MNMLPIKVFLLNPEIVFKNVQNRYPFKDKLKPYTKKDIEYTIEYYKLSEEFEKCAILHNFLKERFGKDCKGWE